MYAATVIERAQAAVEKALGIKLTPYAVAESVDRTQQLARLAKPDGELTRPLVEWEKQFIRNERLLSRLDFRYWATRYVHIQLDGGGFGRMVFERPQEIALDRHLAPAEEAMYQAVQEGAPVDGLLFYWHKARQTYATMTARALTMHRMLFTQHVVALGASVGSPEDAHIRDLYDRDKRILDNLPWWMRPQIEYDVKASHLRFGQLDNNLFYQDDSQKSGMAQGKQVLVHHLTELAFWKTPEWHVGYVLDGGIPQSRHVLGIRESTANGRDNWWHEKTELARRSKLRKWRYIFIPYYVLTLKYRARPTPEWRPSQAALLHAERVWATSAEFTGQPYRLLPEQLYWWDMMREENRRDGTLAEFLTNSCATPEESFQHSGNVAFAPELLEQWRDSARPMMCSEVTIQARNRTVAAEVEAK
jgi:hypothetical protein